MFRRPILVAPLFLITVASLAAVAQKPLPQTPFDSPAQAEPIHYYNGDVRVERLLALDELAVVSETERAPLAQDLAGPGRSVEAGERGRERVAVRFDTPAFNRAELSSRARSLRLPETAVRAVAFAYGDSERSETTREVITDRLGVKLRNPDGLERILQEYDLEVVEMVGSAHVLRTRSDDLLAAVDAANALYERGIAEFATPLIARQQQPRLIPNDPLFQNQWHLNNTGQVTGAIVGNDANIVETWNTHTGAGVNIAVTDTGVQTTHPDLSGNARTDIDWDYNDNDDDPTPQSFSHGTSVAGIAAADGNNGAGVTGAAFDAGIVGVRLIEEPTTDADEANAMSHQVDPVVVANRVHINNNSWGPSDDGQRLETFGPLTRAALQDGVALGRGGLGVIYVWAGGNGRQSSDNVNYDGYASSRYTIAVGASGGNGTVSYYSEPGASLLVNTPSSYDSAGTTTTTTGSQYTSSFGGTSSAAPLAAGSIALMLQANPNLGWRDVQHILVDTAFQNQPGGGGWVANGSGRLFNHNYGFGRIDTQAAVARSENWVNLEPEIDFTTEIKTVNAPIPDASPGGVTSSIPVVVPAGFFVEHVEVILNTTHSYAGDLRIELTSPEGMKSTLAALHNSNANYSNWKFTSVAHWGENASGTWSLKIADDFTYDTGTFDNWRLIVYGFTIGADVVGVNAEHTGFVNGHPNWPYTDFQSGYAAVDSGGTLYLGSDVSVGAPMTLSKPVVIRTTGGAARISGN